MKPQDIFNKNVQPMLVVIKSGIVSQNMILSKFFFVPKPNPPYQLNTVKTWHWKLEPKEKLQDKEM